MKITKSEGALVADKDLFATVDGRLVDADDPDANALIARAGQPIPAHLAEQLGIEETPEAPKDRKEAKEDEDDEKSHAHRASATSKK